MQDVRGPAVDAAVKESQRLMTLLQKSAFAWKHKAHAQHQVRTVAPARRDRRIACAFDAHAGHTACTVDTAVGGRAAA